MTTDRITSLIEEQGRAFDDFISGTKSEVRNLREEMDNLTVAFKRGAWGEDTKANGASLETKAFNGFVRRGEASLEANEVKALRLSDDTSGGILAPSTFVNELIKQITEISPMRAIARVMSLSAKEAQIPRRDSSVVAQWVAELEEKPLSQPSFGQVTLSARELGAYVEASNSFLEDSGINIEEELMSEFAEQFAAAEGQAFVSGDGVNRPKGFLLDSSIPQMATGSPSSVTADALISAQHTLKQAYRSRAVWVMNKKTLGSVRKLKDSNNQYIWAPGIAAGNPDTLLGMPVVEMADMPDEAAGALPIAFGDFRRGYRIMDRRQMSVIRDPFTKARRGVTCFTASMRVAGDVIQPEAIVLLKCASS